MAMINKKKLAFFSFLFFIVFTIVGDSYIYYLDGKVFESDYRYETDIKDRNLKEEYVQDLKKYSDEFNLRIYVATTEVTSKNSATYTVYASDENKDYIKNRSFQRKTTPSSAPSLVGKETLFSKTSKTSRTFMKQTI